MKKILCFIVVAFFCINVSNAQSYSKVKVALKSGLITKGSKATLTDESISFLQSGSQKTYALTDVLTIQAREGKAGKWALYSGAGCLGICAIAGIASGSEGIEDAGGTVGTYVAGSFLWAGIFAGVGALIGSVSDKYQNVYLSSSTSLLKKFDLNLSSTHLTMKNPTKYNLTLSYKF